MFPQGIRLVCKCGQVHLNTDTIISKRDPLANQVKTYCRRCMRRIYLTKVTNDTSAHRRQFTHSGQRS